MVLCVTLQCCISVQDWQVLSLDTFGHHDEGWWIFTRARQHFSDPSSRHFSKTPLWTIVMNKLFFLRRYDISLLPPDLLKLYSFVGHSPEIFKNLIHNFSEKLPFPTALIYSRLDCQQHSNNNTCCGRRNCMMKNTIFLFYIVNLSQVPLLRKLRKK